jgi:hypothetical protein
MFVTENVILKNIFNFLYVIQYYKSFIPDKNENTINFKMHVFSEKKVSSFF